MGYWKDLSRLTLKSSVAVLQAKGISSSLSANCQGACFIHIVWSRSRRLGVYVLSCTISQVCRLWHSACCQGAPLGTVVGTPSVPPPAPQPWKWPEADEVRAGPILNTSYKSYSRDDPSVAGPQPNVGLWSRDLWRESWLAWQATGRSYRPFSTGALIEDSCTTRRVTKWINPFADPL